MSIDINSLLLNLFIVWFVFRYSEVVIKMMGNAGSQAVAKVAALFLAGIAVMMIRVGLSKMIRSSETLPWKDLEHGSRS